jgi:hypothetical protein
VSELVTLIGGLGALIGAIYGIAKLLDRWFYKSPAAKDADIDVENQEAQKKFEETGRP